MRSAFSRSLIPAALVLMAALLLVGAAFQVLVKNYLTKKAMDELNNNCAVICDLVLAYHSSGTINSGDFLLNLSLSEKLSDTDALICDASGTLLFCSDSPMGCEHQGMRIRQEYLSCVLSSDSISSTGTVSGLYKDTRFIVARSVRTADAKPAYIIIASSPTQQIVSVVKKLSNIYVSVAILAMLLSITLMAFFTRRHSKPLRDMANAANDFGHGRLDSRVYVDRRASEEMRDLALAFNNMAGSLQKSEYQRQEFVANVSHELKTPMTTISGFVDGMLDGTIPPERHRHYMQLVSDETKRLNRLVRSMLDISHLQNGSIEDSKTRFDAEECAGQVLITFEQKIVEKNLSVAVQMPSHPVYTFANLDQITQVLYNLVDNAVKFCPVDGNLGLRIYEQSNKIYVTISNDGPTIPAEELPLLFDRFHKLDKSRSENRDGWGLGLYIAKTIICAHGEDISVSSKNEKTEFTFTLPLVN